MILDYFPGADGDVYAAAVSGNTLYIGGDFTHVGPATGGGVPFSVTSGLPVQGFPKVKGSVYSVAADGSGGWYIGGEFRAVGGIPRRNLAQINRDNTVSDFNPSASDVVFAVAVKGATVYAGGWFTVIAGQSRQYIAALDASTGQATSWNPGSNATVVSLAAGRNVVYVGGGFTLIGGAARSGCAAFDATTGHITAWNPYADGGVNAIVESGQTVYLGGLFGTVGGQTRHYLAAVDTLAGQATAWNPSPNGPVSALAEGGGIVYVGGFFGSIGGQSRSNIAALDSVSGNATAWSPAVSSTVNGLTLSGGSVFVSGYFSAVSGNVRHSLAALDIVTGQVTDWNPDPSGGAVYALASSSEAVYAGGDFLLAGAAARHYVAAVDTRTGQVTSWDPHANSRVDALVVGKGAVFAGGDFTQIGGQTRNSIAALDTETGMATAWDAHGVANALVVHALAVGNDKVYAAFGGGATFGGQYRYSLAAFDTSTGFATPWSAPANDDVWSLAVGDGFVYAGGYFTNIGGLPRAYLAAIDTATGQVSPWAPNPSCYVSSMTTRPGVVYVGGCFATIAGQTRNGAAAFDASTGALLGWNPGALGSVGALAVNATSAVAAGYRKFADYVGAFNPATGQSLGWQIGPDDNVNVLAASPSAVFVGGRFIAINNDPRPKLAAFITDGVVPTLPSLVNVDVSAGRVALCWESASAAGLAATVYRRRALGDWEFVGHPTLQGVDRLCLEDRAVTAGERYAYRLGYVESGAEQFTAETWIDIPLAPTFALDGFRPNPAVGEPTVAFSLRTSEAASLEVVDVSGRRVARREVGSLGAGAHVVRLGEASALKPGIYWLRLRQGDRVLLTRGAVVR